MRRNRVQAGRSRTVSRRKSAKVGSNFVRPRFNHLLTNTHNARPQSARVELIYNEWGQAVNPSIASAGVHVFAANGLFDPNITGVGHQPTGFDQYMALYNQYIVVGSTIRAVVSNSDGNNLANVGVFLMDSASTSTDWNRYVENGNGVWTVADKLGTGDAVKILTHRADISKFSRQSILNDDVFAGTVSANPGETHYYHLVVAPSDGAADNAACIWNVEIRYDVIFRDPAMASAS